MITIHMAASLDGFIARKDGRVDWMETADHFDGGETLSPEFIAEFLKTIDCYVMGSRTYETALGFEAKGFGWSYGDKPVFVLTTRALPRTRDTVEFHSGDLAAFVNERLRPAFRNIWFVGGGVLSAECIRLGLADEVRYSMLPVLIGDGIRFFERLDTDVALHLLEVKAYDSGTVGLRVRGAEMIQFTDGAGYERYMGQWSQLAGRAFLEWLAAPHGWRWLDVGCGNGAFTELIVDECAPASVHGIDPSEAQLAFARSRARTRDVEFHQGSATSLPFSDGAFDAAVMPLVIVFVPDPAKGVREMARVVRSGGVVAAYMWGQTDGGFPYHMLQSEMAALGAEVLTPPSPDAAQVSVMQSLWTASGLREVSTHQVTVERTFVDFNDYLTTIRSSPSLGRSLAAMSATDFARLEARLRALLPADANGRITYQARANCVKGQVL